MSSDKLPAATIDETCPHCGETLHDLWDYGGRGQNSIDTNCPHCDKPINIEPEYSVIYTISARVK